MNAINRQKFLAELAKLLTFMYEEDRQYALGMYERMFDIADEDEQWLIQNLMSPTRQAVIIARSYDAKERKLSVEAQYKDDEYEEQEGTPPFVLAINKIFDDLFPEEEEAEEPAEDQVSFFDLGVAPEPEKPEKPRMPKAAVLLDNTQEFELNLDELPNPEEERDIPEAADTADEAADTEAADTEAADAGEALADELPQDEAVALPPEPETVATEDSPEAAEETAQPDPVPESTQEPEPQPAEEQPKKKRSIASLLGLDREKAEEPPRQESMEPAPEAEEAPAKPVEAEKAEEPAAEAAEDVHPEEEHVAVEAEAGPAPEPIDEEKPVIQVPSRKKTEKKRARRAETKRVMQVPRLVLFLIVAVPVTAALLLLLLVPTAICLVLTCGLSALGATLIVSAFSGFAVLADILLLLGAAIVVLALGLLCLWLAFSLVGGVMVGLVQSVIELAWNWCSKEVPAE